MPLQGARSSGCERSGDEAARRRRHCWPDMVQLAMDGWVRARGNGMWWEEGDDGEKP
jgi:hypothetical protein